MKNVLFSITTPTYNRAHTLKVLYKSLVSQTCKDFEWIIGDDGSTDKTEKLVKTFIKDKKINIRYLKLQHTGKNNTCSVMDEVARGKYIVPIDSDDELAHNGVLSEIKQKIKNSPKGISICGCFINQYNEIFPKFDGEYYDITHDNFFDILVNCPERLNIFSVLLNGSYNKKQTNIIQDGLCFYPEILIIARDALNNKNFYRRVFNKAWYKYNMFNDDSITVSLSNNKMSAAWYEYVDMINLFYEYGIDKKYQEYIYDKLDTLWQRKWFNKNFVDTYKRLKSKKYKMYFLFHKIMKYIFLIYKTKKFFRIYTFNIVVFSHTKK